MKLKGNAFKKIIMLSTTIIVTYFAGIAYMVTLDAPTFTNQNQPEMTAKQIDDLGFEQKYQHSIVEFNTRDAKVLRAQKFQKDTDVTVLVLHGILSSSYMNNRFSGLLSEAANAEVYSLDLRGHGSSDGNPGDVDYIGQYVDDIADVVKQIKDSKPNGKIIIAGHSMGGGLTLRYSLEENVPDIDGYLLFAPQLGDNAPTNSFPNDAERQADSSFMAIHMYRLIGLVLLNSMNIDHWNDLPVFFFNLPPGMPLSQYTYRSSASMSPQDYKEGLQSVDKPMLVIVGGDDEAFNAPVYKDVIQDFSQGEFLLIEGQTHNGIRHDKLAMQRVRQWTAANQLLGE